MAHKHFFNKLLNADDAAHLVDAGELINMENIRFGTSDSGETGDLENIRGTVLRSDRVVTTPPDGITTGQKFLGGAVDEASRFIAWFVHRPAGEGYGVFDAIYLYDKSSGVTHKVMTSDYCADLKFHPNRLIQAVIVNDALYWTDNHQPPRMLHLGAAIELLGGDSPVELPFQFTDALTLDDLSLVRKPFGLPPSIYKDTDENFGQQFVGMNSYQFAVQYIYYTGETTVLSPFSKASRINAPNENYNIIRVYLPSTERIPQAVRMVRLVVQFEDTRKCFVVKTWDRKKVQDNADMVAHNMGLSLSYTFYGKATGEAIDSALAVQPYHSVPLRCKTVAAARNRLFLGNYTEGYDTPASTSLQFGTTTVDITSTSITKPMKRLIYYHKSDGFHYLAWAVYMTELTPVGWYILKSTVKTGYSGNLLGPAPSTTAYTDLEFYGVDKVAVDAKIDKMYNFYDFTSCEFDLDGGNVSITGMNVAIYNTFKSKSEYRLGVVFYDAALRKCGVVTNDSLTVSLPSRAYTLASAVNSIQWTLANSDDMAGEIPEWAHYYAVVMTKNLHTRHFVQGIDLAPKYATKDDKGSYVFTQTTYVNTVAAVALDLSSVTNPSLGYTYTEGDMCLLLGSDGSRDELPVIGVFGSYVLLQAKDIGDLTNRDILFELYTPHQASEQEPFYEIGAMHPVANPGTASRAYSQLNGVISANAYAISRSHSSATYFAETMCANDKCWMRWVHDEGRINIHTSRGQATNRTGVRFSNTFIPGTDTNGLSAFEALNQETLPIEIGELQKLQLTSKAQSEGTVMLGIGKVETVSMYLGEAQLSDVAGNSMLIRSVGVIGQVNLLQGSLGTLHPESVAVSGGRVFWLDVLRSTVASYSANGLFANSVYKFRRVSKLLCAKLATMNVAIPGGIDPFHNEYCFSVPQTENEPPKGQLTDYSPAIDYPYDFYDGKAKTWVYKMDGDRLQGAQGFVAEGFVSLGEGFFSFKDGTLWEHNASDTFDHFYGLTVKPMIAFVENGQPDSQVKVFKNLALEANLIPAFTHIRTEVPYVQSSDLVVGDWQTKEGIHYAAILRDRLSPNEKGDVNHKLWFGDEMRGQWAKIMLEWETFGDPLNVRFVNVDYAVSSGHKNI